eukprot:18305_1
MLFSLHIFIKDSTCIYQQTWNDGNEQKNHPQKTPQEFQRLLFGLLHSLKEFSNKMSPEKMDEFETEQVRSLTTEGYKLHYLESMSGVRFVMVTDVNVASQRNTLLTLYNMYVEHVLKNPNYTPGSYIDCEHFISKLQTFTGKLIFFEK